MSNIIKVGMADLNITTRPGILTTLGLGSCVGICIYDSSTKIAGMAHIMLPSSKTIKNNQNQAKFADTAIECLIKKMMTMGANKYRLTSKIAGGAQMFSFMNKNDLMKIGERNVVATREILSNLKIPIKAEDIGGNYGRTIEFNSINGILTVKTIGYGIKEL